MLICLYLFLDLVLIPHSLCTYLSLAQSINVSDISELRPGSHSLAFVRSGSTANDKEVCNFSFLLAVDFTSVKGA